MALSEVVVKSKFNSSEREGKSENKIGKTDKILTHCLYIEPYEMGARCSLLLFVLRDGCMYRIDCEYYMSHEL